MGQHQNFHEGEKQLQAEDGVDVDGYEAVMTQPYSPELNPTEVRFVNGRTFAVAATVDANGRPWATPLFGQAGELFAVEDSTTVRIQPNPEAVNQLTTDLASNDALGVLYFDPSLRRRSKSLGTGTVEADGSITYQMHRNFGICNKYIFKRTHQPSTAQTAAGSDNGQKQGGQARSDLTVDDIKQLGSADTTFLASHHVVNGADATHRGGPAGFVIVEDVKDGENATILVPDYPGNGMFNSLGNIVVDNRVGLTAVDFATGRVLQVSGRGTIVSSPEDDPFSTRTLRIAIEQVRSTVVDIGTWTDVEAFPIRPGLYNPGTPYLPGRRPTPAAH